MVPRHRRETDRPLRPRLVYSMSSTLPRGWAQCHVELLQASPTCFPAHFRLELVRDDREPSRHLGVRPENERLCRGRPAGDGEPQRNGHTSRFNTFDLAKRLEDAFAGEVLA